MTQNTRSPYLAVPEPPFIAAIPSENQANRRLAFLAWYVVTRMSKKNTQTLLKGQKGNKKLASYIIQCRAWYWLWSMPHWEIQQRLLRMQTPEADAFRLALNQLQPEYKTYRQQAEKEINNAN